MTNDLSNLKFPWVNESAKKSKICWEKLPDSLFARCHLSNKLFLCAWGFIDLYSTVICHWGSLVVMITNFHCLKE